MSKIRYVLKTTKTKSHAHIYNQPQLIVSSNYQAQATCYYDLVLFYIIEEKIRLSTLIIRYNNLGPNANKRQNYSIFHNRGTFLALLLCFKIRFLIYN